MTTPMRRLIALIAVVAVVITVLWAAYSYLTSFQKLTVNMAAGTPVKATVYRLPPHANETAPLSSYKTQKNLVQQVTSTTTLKVKKGTYLVSAGGGTDYAIQDVEVSADNQPGSVDINPDFTESKLASLLNSELPAIKAAITAAQPAVSRGYTIDPGRLYHKGDWYGTIISPTLTPEQQRVSYVDIYRLVAHKENGAWKVLTTPDLSLSAALYPQIPKDVLSGVNKLTL
jgi:hypothetical protein